MDTDSEFVVSLDELNTALGTIEDAYSFLSARYYLPKQTSKAINKTYLTRILLKNSYVLKVQRTITRHHIDYHASNIGEMLEKLEAFLKLNDKPPTGMGQLRLPDYAWIYDVCVWLDPTNTMKIPRVQVSSENNITRVIDSE